MTAHAATHSAVPTPMHAWKGAKPLPTLAVLSLGVFLWLLPAPTGLDLKTWHLFGIFVTTIFGVIAKPLPMGAIAIIAMGSCVATKTLTLEQSLSSFNSHVVWLVLLTFFMARGFVKTGLGSRIAYLFIRTFGSSTLGLSYALCFSDLILAPVVPSNTARGAGILFPIVNSLCIEQGSAPHDGTRRHFGAYLIKVVFQANIITSAMFVTALAGNPLIVSLAGELGVTMTWVSWMVAALVPGLVNLLVLPWLLYLLYPPQTKRTPHAPQMARQQLDAMGPLSAHEKLMVGTFISLLMLWIAGESIGISATAASLFGLGFLLFSGVLSWNDVLNEKTAWETLVWFAALLMMATQLSKMGMVTWFSHEMQGAVGHFPWGWSFGILCAVYFYSHYFFASATAHISSMYSAFLVVIIAAGAPAGLAAMSLAVLSSLCACLTHYGTGTAPVYFGSGYVSVSEWWRLGGILSLVYLGIWSVVGGLWWKIIGLW